MALLCLPMAPGAPGGPLGGPWRVPEGSQRVQILVFGHFEAIRGWVRPGLGQIDDVLTSYDFLWPRGPLGSPWGVPGRSEKGPNMYFWPF